MKTFDREKWRRNVKFRYPIIQMNGKVKIRKSIDNNGKIRYSCFIPEYEIFFAAKSIAEVHKKTRVMIMAWKNFGEIPKDGVRKYARIMFRQMCSRQADNRKKRGIVGIDAVREDMMRIRPKEMKIKL